jgi:hypothetical protein
MAVRLPFWSHVQPHIPYVEYDPRNPASGQTDFYGQQMVIAREVMEAGECFVRFRPRSPKEGLADMAAHELNFDRATVSKCLPWEGEQHPQPPGGRRRSEAEDDVTWNALSVIIRGAERRHRDPFELPEARAVAVFSESAVRYLRFALETMKERASPQCRIRKRTTQGAFVRVPHHSAWWSRR